MATLIHLENQNDCKTATIYDIIEKTELMETNYGKSIEKFEKVQGEK